MRPIRITFDRAVRMTEHIRIGRPLARAVPNDKGTPVARPVRKAMGLHEIARPPQGNV
jgi:hypothetical protein